MGDGGPLDAQVLPYLASLSYVEAKHRDADRPHARCAHLEELASRDLHG
jgi:hypothetical protein